ncbi:hypothetical protein [Mycolicibacterium arenosum]|uniref:UsfY protein n=1 Tax=Mycolicibacterium arenosum TaxID=2952157 RepID=A0ABT1MCQ4_9MYCO|nr:hypothetical protein [Mycolicibacterium sp. CAU 1645]MCP9276946.1 hypothetical protein [Mycolicibacterium sp. CAU 1645]
MSDAGREPDRGPHPGRHFTRLMAAGAFGATALILLGVAEDHTGVAATIGIIAAVAVLVVARWANRG